MSHVGEADGEAVGPLWRWCSRLGGRTWAWWLPLPLIALDVAADLAARSREP
ncbi:hypothetical protein ABT218_21845 [Streptomyces sp. NPDC001455]|uniref:hypothetical protein n=1 Tax=unclassified Streptomyces TaxID=2593676 RepID=UPI00331C7833